MHKLFLIFLIMNGLWTNAVAAEARLKVGVVLDKGGRDDRSFNQAALEGVKAAKKDFDFVAKDVVATDDTAFETLLTKFARRDFHLAFGIGFAQKDAVAKVAKRFPKMKFALVDAVLEMPNVRSLVFAEHEGAFLAGALAAMKSQTHKLGFVGGMDIPLIRRFQMGYAAGARFVNPKTEVITHYVGVTGSAWNNPARAKELALTQIDAGADIIFAAAGASGFGVFDAIEERAKARPKHPLYGIGVDSNQNSLKPGLILTSMLKRIDVAVYETIKMVKGGAFKSGVIEFDLADNGVDLAFDKYNAGLVSDAMRKTIADLKTKIIAGKVKVPDYYELRQKAP